MGLENLWGGGSKRMGKRELAAADQWFPGLLREFAKMQIPRPPSQRFFNSRDLRGVWGVCIFNELPLCF